MYSCEFCEISKNTFFTEHLWTTASSCPAITFIIRFQQKNESHMEKL